MPQIKVTSSVFYWIPAFAGMTIVLEVPVIPAQAGIHKSFDFEHTLPCLRIRALSSNRISSKNFIYYLPECTWKSKIFCYSLTEQDFWIVII